MLWYLSKLWSRDLMSGWDGLCIKKVLLPSLWKKHSDLAKYNLFKHQRSYMLSKRLFEVNSKDSKDSVCYEHVLQSGTEHEFPWNHHGLYGVEVQDLVLEMKARSLFLQCSYCPLILTVESRPCEGGSCLSQIHSNNRKLKGRGADWGKKHRARDGRLETERGGIWDWELWQPTPAIS